MHFLERPWISYCDKIQCSEKCHAKCFISVGGEANLVEVLWGEETSYSFCAILGFESAGF